MKLLKCTSLLALVATAPALAEETIPEDRPAGDKTIIVSASRVTSEAREIGSAVTVIEREEIERDQIVFVKDLLHDAPGVTVNADRPGGFTSVTIRGSNNDEVLWLLDGIELGDPSAISTEFRADHLVSRDIARVEVLRGNQSSLYGSDAIGGVINIITRRAEREGLEVDAEAEAGSHETVNGGLSILGRSGPLDFRLSSTGYRHGGPSLADPRTATGPTSEKDEYWRYGFSGRAGLAAAEGLELQVTGLWQNSFSDLDNVTSDSSDEARKKEYAFAGQARYRSADKRFSAALTGSRYVARSRYFGAFNRADGDRFKGTKDQLALNLAFDTGGIASFAAGGSYEPEKADQLTNFSGSFRARSNTLSGYAEVALRPTDALTVTGAARVDDNSRFGTFDTYRGTVAYALDGLKLRASYGTGAKAPGLYQLFDPTYGNPNLEVEKSRGGDIGFDFALTDAIELQLSYFFLRKRNEIVFDASRPPFGGYAQFGRTHAEGVEVGASFRPAPWLRLDQAYTYTDHEVDTGPGGFRDSGRPRYVASSTASLIPAAGVELSARARHHDGDASGFGGSTDAYTVVDLLGSWRLSDRVELYGRVVNLFDEWYQVSFGTQSLGRSAYAGVRLSLP